MFSHFKSNRVVSTLLLFLTINAHSIFAQESFTLYHISPIAQSQYYNLTSQPLHKINFGFPILGSLYFGASNSGFRYSDLIRKTVDDSLFFDMDNALSKLEKTNYLGSNFEMDILSFGIKFNNSFLNFSVKEHGRLMLRYPKDLVDFVWNGNGPTLGQKMNLNLGLEMMHYRSYGVSFNHEFQEKFGLGIGVKYLYGMENIHTERSDISITTNPSDYAITANSDILLNTSGITQGSYVEGELGRYLFGKKNTGFAADFGAHYKPIENLKISLSVLDIGGITWRSNIRSYESVNPNANYTFRGLNLGDLINDTTTINDAFNQTLDSIYNNFRIDTNSAKYRTRLSPQVYLGGIYQLNETFAPGILFYGQFFDGNVHPAVSVSMNMHLTRMWHLSASYSIYNRSATNLGLGTSINTWGGTQFYLVSDNVLGAIFPQNAKTVNIRFGINLRFGTDPYRDDEDDDGVPDHEDKCPRLAGLPELRGCPDSDGDKISDNEDNCPNEPGLAKFQGCPDKDGDNIIDKFDECPEIPGTMRFKGCPDKDNDGIKDVDDDCPDIKGLAEFKGCPDTDGDGIKDAEDACPDQFGNKDQKGCPNDKDQDGIPDLDDKCPDEAGTKINGGCPDKDTDGDGILDRDDNCPQLKGKADQKGCPEISKEILDKVASSSAQIKFENGKDQLLTSSYSALEEISKVLKSHPELKIIVESHTGMEGNESFNMTLSKDRGNAIVNYFKLRNIDLSRIKMEAFGSEKPIADNNTEAGKKANSRTVVVLQY
jgi:outer membrane protein OmpA-like peptidoglycan-associated protein